MSLLAYFDTNIFDNLVKQTNGVTEEHLHQIEAAASLRKISILVSHLNVRESLAALGSAPEIAKAQLSLLLRFADWERLVREHSTILERDIRHFAYNGERANSPFDSDRNAVNVRKGIMDLINGTLGTKDMEPILRENSEQKKAMLNGVRKSRAETKVEIEEFRKMGQIPTFEEWYNECWRDYLMAFLEDCGVTEQCRGRGLDNMMKIPSLGAMIGFGMSYVYGVAVERCTPKGSDSRDMQHVVCAAAAADVLVTHDEELSRLLGRVPVRGLRVMRLQELLKLVQST